MIDFTIEQANYLYSCVLMPRDRCQVLTQLIQNTIR